MVNEYVDLTLFLESLFLIGMINPGCMEIHEDVLSSLLVAVMLMLRSLDRLACSYQNVKVLVLVGLDSFDVFTIYVGPNLVVCRLGFSINRVVCFVLLFISLLCYTCDIVVPLLPVHHFFYYVLLVSPDSS